MTHKLEDQLRTNKGDLEAAADQMNASINRITYSETKLQNSAGKTHIRDPKKQHECIIFT